MKTTIKSQKISNIEIEEPFSQEEEWYYDETEQIWKRLPGGMALKRIISIAMPSAGKYLLLQPGQ